MADLVNQFSENQQEGVRKVYEQMKEDATYWLGITTLAEGDYEIAMDYLGRMTLFASPDGRWASAARVNLAEAKILAGDSQGAIQLLREDRSPQRFGSRFRARQIASELVPQTSRAQPEDETKPSPSE
jgi:outer membrane protein assembly factor BamD (BamD/ComL family)